MVEARERAPLRGLRTTRRSSIRARVRGAAARAWTWVRDEHGQSLVELGLAAPILVSALIAGVDLMRVAAVNQAVQNAARAAVEYAAVRPTAASSALAMVISAELRSASGIGTIRMTPTACWGAVLDPPAGVAPPVGEAYYTLPCQPVGGRYQGVTATSAACPGASSGAGEICYLRVRVQYTFQTTVPWPLVPNTITVDRRIASPMYQ